MDPFEEGRNAGSAVRESRSIESSMNQRADGSAEATARVVLQRTVDRLSSDVYRPVLKNGHVKVLWWSESDSNGDDFTVFCHPDGRFSVSVTDGDFWKPLRGLVKELGELNIGNLSGYDRFLGFYEGMTLEMARGAKHRFEANRKRSPEDIQFEIKVTVGVALFALIIFVALW